MKFSQFNYNLLSELDVGLKGINSNAIFKYLCYDERARVELELLANELRTHNSLQLSATNFSKNEQTLLTTENMLPYLADLQNLGKIKSEKIERSIKVLENTPVIYAKNETEFTLTGGQSSILNGIYKLVEKFRKDERDKAEARGIPYSNNADIIEYVKKVADPKLDPVIRPKAFGYIPGYEVNLEKAPITAEIYAEVLNHANSMKPFNQKHDESRADAKNHSLEKYVYTILFGNSKNTTKKPYVVSLLEERFLGRSKNVYITSLEDYTNKSTGGNSELDAKGKKEDLIEKFDSMHDYKEIFCVLAIANKLRKNLFPAIQILLSKYLRKEKNVEELLGFSYTSIANSKEERKLGESEDNKTIRTTLGYDSFDRNWIFECIGKAISWLCQCQYVDISEIEYYNPHVLDRTDLILACRSPKEFIDLFKDNDETIPIGFQITTRERVIIDKLDLTKDYNFLKYKDMVELTQAPLSNLETVIEEKNALIDSHKKTLKQILLNIKEHEDSITEIRRALDMGYMCGEEIDAVKRDFQLNDFETDARYRLRLVKTNKPNAQEQIYFCKKTNGRLVIYNKQGSSIDPGMMDYTWNIIKKEFAKIKLQKDYDIITPEERIQLCSDISQHEMHITTLRGTLKSYTSNLAVSANYSQFNENSRLVSEATVLNTWVKKLHDKYKRFLINTQSNKSSKQAVLRSEAMKFIHSENAKCLNTECRLSYDNPDVMKKLTNANLKSWFIFNSNIYKKRYQSNMLYRIKVSETLSTFDGIDVLANKQGYYVVSRHPKNSDVADLMIIPMWYGCLSDVTLVAQECQERGEFIPHYKQNLLSVINTIINDRASYMKAYNCSQERAEKLISEETGIFFLTSDEAFEAYLEIGDAGFIRSADKNNEVIDYISYYEHLAVKAGVDLEPIQSVKLYTGDGLKTGRCGKVNTQNID